MSRPRKAVVDYFPHYVNDGRIMFTIESKYKNDGYSFYFKTLEILGASEHHFLDCNEIETWEFLLAKTRVSEDIAKDILDTCSRLGVIDKELWENKIVRSNEFIENLNSVYNRREISVLSNEEVLSLCRCKSHSLGVTSNKNLQSKVKDRKVEEHIEKESKHKGEDIQGEENTIPKYISEDKKKEPRKPEIQIQEENPKPNPEAKEKAEIQEPRKSRVRTHKRELLLEADYFNLPDLMEGEPEQESELQEPGLDHDPEAEPDRIVILISAEPKESPVAEEPEPKKSAEPETKSAEMVVEKVRVKNWDYEPEPDKEAPVISIEPKLTVKPESCLEPETKESGTVNAKTALKQDSEELIVEKLKPSEKVVSLVDW